MFFFIFVSVYSAQVKLHNGNAELMIENLTCSKSSFKGGTRLAQITAGVILPANYVCN